MTARLLQTKSVEKVWGRDTLPAPFSAPDGKRIGEIWFEPPEELDDLLGKYLFTSEKLSVQVHPPGKDECWLVLDAEPGAQLAVGFREEYSEAALRQGAHDGSIEHMLEWHEVEAGDFVYLAAGTVHAIGAGCTLVEMQQNCGITYRFFDYGRPRELHLEDALKVADRGPHDRALWSKVGSASQCLAEGEFFRLDRIVGAPSSCELDAHDQRCLILPLEGKVRANGIEADPGQCLLVEGVERADLPSDGVTLVCSPR